MTRLRVRRHRAPGLLLGATACALAACGPTVPTQLGVADLSSNVALGRTAQAAQPPVPKAELQAGFPSFIQPPPLPVILQQPPASAVALPSFHFPTPAVCATPAPGSAAGEAAPADATKPPQQGAYEYRQTGYYLATGIKYPPLPHVSRVVQNLRDVSAAHDGSDVEYDVFVDELVEQTTTTYEVRQPSQPQLGALNPVASGGGIFIAAEHTVYYPGKPYQLVDDFQPTQPVEIAPMPLVVNQQFAGAGTDGIRQEEMDVQGQVVGHEQVNACGTQYDSWKVAVTGHIVTAQDSAHLNRSITATYDIATEMGGLSIADEVQIAPLSPADSAVLPQDITADIDSATPMPEASPKP